jgi:hypothetical protein
VLDQPVIQLQGLIDVKNAATVYVVDCSAPESTFSKLEALYRHVVASLEPIDPDYLAPEGP